MKDPDDAAYSKSLAIIDHQQGIQSKNIGIESQGEDVGIQD